MSDELEKTLDAVEATTASPRAKNNMWLDFGPLLVFFGSFQWFKRSHPDDAMLYAAGVFALAAVIALAISWFRHKKLSGMLLLTTGIIVITAGLALASDNKTIFFMKPTIVNALFGIAVIGGVVMKRNILRLLIGDAFKLPNTAWNTLAIRWGIFFFAMAALNEFVWRTQSEDFWVSFKVFGFLPITILFTLTQIPFISRHGGLSGLETSER